MDINNLNALELAYIGDAVYEVSIREHLLKKGIRKVNNLQKEAKKFVSAKGQFETLNKLFETQFLTQEELEVVKHARNYKSVSKPKNTDIITYKYATGFEALIGYLYITNISRLEELINKILEDK
ncbi:MAG: ribonuclease III [Firmicutes bacterium]|nr:ribonuclease III [Bacillota bacterium]